MISFAVHEFTRLFSFDYDAIHGQFFSRVQLVWIRFSFKIGCHTKIREFSLPYYLPMGEVRE